MPPAADKNPVLQEIRKAWVVRVPLRVALLVTLTATLIVTLTVKLR